MDVSNQIKLMLIDGKYVFDGSESKNSTKNTNHCIDVQFTSDKSEFTAQDRPFKIFDEQFKKIENKLNSSNFRQKDINCCISICEDILNMTKELCLSILKVTSDIEENKRVSMAFIYGIKKFQERNTAQKRRRIAVKDPAFVEPIEKPLGLKWKANVPRNASIQSHKLVQTVFQYVPITDTHKMLFQME